MFKYPLSNFEIIEILLEVDHKKKSSNAVVGSTVSLSILLTYNRERSLYPIHQVYNSTVGLLFNGFSINLFHACIPPKVTKDQKCVH